MGNSQTVFRPHSSPEGPQSAPKVGTLLRPQTGPAFDVAWLRRGYLSLDHEQFARGRVWHQVLRQAGEYVQQLRAIGFTV